MCSIYTYIQYTYALYAPMKLFLVCDQSVDTDEESITFGVCSQSEDG